MTKVLPHELVKEVMLSKVPEKVHPENKKAYELGVKYAQEALAKL
jgi:2-oxoglutarate ferredoxin oxidoreductase subunit gamma